MARTKRVRVLPVRTLVWLLAGAVVIPAILSIAVGVVALALSQQAVDIVVGVLVLCFAVSAVSGGFVAFGLLRRSERLAQMQTDFVANVSHELRTPIAGIRVLGEALSLGRVTTPEKRAEVGSLIVEQTSRLQGLVDRILRWRRLEAGAFELDPEPQSLGPIVEDAVQPYRAACGESLIVDVDASLPPVSADRSALIDVVRNLVDNAVKFGADQGTIEVVARHRGDEVVIEVHDQGPGIPAGERQRIFERFYRVPVHLRTKQGAGLGLSIVQSVVHAHHGRVEVHSEPGIGTTFIVSLPACDPSELVRPAHEGSPEEVSM